MTNKNLYLVGTVHLDIRGPKRLENLLREISPDIIALEHNKDRGDLKILRKAAEVEERELYQMLDEAGLKINTEQRNTLMQSIRFMENISGYELKTCKKYSEINKKALDYIDMSVFKNGKEEFIDGYKHVAIGFLKEISQHPELKKQYLTLWSSGIDDYIESIQLGTDIMYINSRYIEDLAKLLRDPETFEIFKKELPENAIKTLEQMYNPKRDEFMAEKIRCLYGGSKKVVGVVGLGHIPGLKSKILDLEPTILTLADF